jgi:hypothetical protein
MTDHHQPRELLKDWTGSPYPASVQRFVALHIDPVTDPVDDSWTDDLRHALESVAAVAREHPTPADPDAGDDDPTLRLGIFTSGFASGVTTYLRNVGQVPQVLAMHTGIRFAGRVFSDPLVRQQLIADLATYDPTSSDLTATIMTSHPAHRHDGDSPT